MRRLFSHVSRDLNPSSSVKIFRKTKPSTTTRQDKTNTTNTNKPQQSLCTANSKISCIGNEIETQDGQYAENRVNIQMISKNLHEQVFASKPRKPLSQHDEIAEKLIANLKFHQIDPSERERLTDVHLKLPPLRGSDIEEHFHSIAQEQLSPYEALLQPFVEQCTLPKRPTKWECRAGWTKYNPITGTSSAIEYPSEDGLILDVEVCVTEGAAPVLATAVSPTHWYSWISKRLMTPKLQQENQIRHRYTPSDMVPLGGNSPRLVIGHNVSYDRARLREEYFLANVGTRFIDTMALHVCVSGITSYQRSMLKSHKQPSKEDASWRAKSALNNLGDVHKLYCSSSGSTSTIKKEPRNIFVEGTLADVRADLQALISYCASDVIATAEVFRVLFPLFRERFPHPVTLAGLLELGSAYLPVNSNWERFLKEADLTYEELDIEAKYHLSRRADEACGLLQNENYRKNIWLWNEDWSVQELKLNKSRRSVLSSCEVAYKNEFKSVTNKYTNQEINDIERLRVKFQNLYKLGEQLPARRPLLPGYPAWYRKLCVKPPPSSRTTKNVDASASAIQWSPGPVDIGTGMQIAPKLLSLCWEGYPLHHTREHGWGFLIPFRNSHPEGVATNKIPIEELVTLCPVPEYLKEPTYNESEYAMSCLQKELEAKSAKREYYTPKTKKLKECGNWSGYAGMGVWCNHILENSCYLIKLPHKNGPSQRVGNPLSRDFLNKFTENVLTSGDAMGEDSTAARVIGIARMMSYWRNNRDRIIGQLVVWLPKQYLQNVEQHFMIDYGAICPLVVTCGTLTRRAMEPTWLTASNSQSERIGSELRMMVQAPPGYRIVGADVDSQELWIASVIGDAYAYGEHGATPLGWMTLSGTKARGTDMHSITAKAVGISRNHAKVINYARIYGAGQNFAEGLLKQFNPSFSATEAKRKAAKMYAITKGSRMYKLREEFAEQCDNQQRFSAYQAFKFASAHRRPISELFYPPLWQNGTESAMFNRLEEIAMGEAPVTPFLNCRLSRALEADQTSGNGHENRFLPTRVNWVVQSGAVDYLHLMLICMRWLMGDNVRFCLSFHDEVRYLVKEELAYKAALAMHVTNLMVRCFCSARIGIHDLPMSVAFFSSVEVDSVLRKESSMDCKTPSNPHGLKHGYGIYNGESLDVYQCIKKAGGGDLTTWGLP